MKKFVLFTVAITAFSSLSFADVDKLDTPQECYEVRLDKNEGPYAKLPVYNQALGTKTDPNICYAVSASLLIDAYRIRQGDKSGTLSSPISLALDARLSDSKLTDNNRSYDYNDSDPVTYLVGGGTILSALKTSQHGRVCDQSWLDQHVPLINNSAEAQPLDRFLTFLTNNLTISSPNPDLICTAINKMDHLCEGHLLKIDFPTPREYKFSAGDYLSAQADLVKRLQDSSLSSDERKALVANFQERFGPERKIKAYGEVINDLLNHPMSTGVGIGYFHKALGPVTGGDAAGHASVIVGRRFNQVENKCEYLVRDSYGSSCTDENGKLRYELPCENGSVWVQARRLLKDTMNLTWIPAE